MTPNQKAPTAIKAHMRNHCSYVYPKKLHCILRSCCAHVCDTKEKNSTLRVPKSVIKYIKIDRQSGLSRFLLTDSEGSIVQ